MALRAKAAQSLIWTVLESAGLSVLSFVTLVVVARFVTPTELGIVTIALGIVQILALPVEIFFHDALVQGRDTDESSYNSAFTVSVLTACALVAGCWALRGPVSDLLGSPQAGLLLGVLSLSLIPLALSSSLVARSRRELAFKALATRSLAGRSVGAAAGIVCAVSGLGVWSLVVQQLAMTTCACALLWVLSPHRPRFTLRWSPARPMVRFGSSSLTNNVLLVAEPRAFAFLVAGALSPAAAGYLNLALRVVDMPRDVMAGAAGQLALPLLRQIDSDVAATRRAYTEAVSFTCLLGFPVFFGLAACAPEVVELVFGRRWLPSAPIVVVFALLTVVYFPKLYSGAVVTARGKPQALTPVLLVSLGTVVVGMLVVGHQSLALALAVWVARLVTSLPVEIAIAQRVGRLGVRDQFRGTTGPFLAASGMAGLVWLLGNGALDDTLVWLRLSLMVVSGALVYAVLVWFLDRAAVVRLAGFLSMMRQPGQHRDAEVVSDG